MAVWLLMNHQMARERFRASGLRICLTLEEWLALSIPVAAPVGGTIARTSSDSGIAGH